MFHRKYLHCRTSIHGSGPPRSLPKQLELLLQGDQEAVVNLNTGSRGTGHEQSSNSLRQGMLDWSSQCNTCTPSKRLLLMLIQGLLVQAAATGVVKAAWQAAEHACPWDSSGRFVLLLPGDTPQQGTGELWYTTAMNRVTSGRHAQQSPVGRLILDKRSVVCCPSPLADASTQKFRPQLRLQCDLDLTAQLCMASTWYIVKQYLEQGHTMFGTIAKRSIQPEIDDGSLTPGDAQLAGTWLGQADTQGGGGQCTRECCSP